MNILSLMPNNSRIGQINDVLRMINGRDPEQLAREIARQRGISDAQLSDLVNQAKNSGLEDVIKNMK